ncbi:MAG: phosphoribosylglycinamide formyltransferase, partial [Deltaproteobacteria bacterium]|nr:phosphoribosylglycinamide formyltransferase [Deltaproteobacteria bacterium]
YPAEIAVVLSNRSAAGGLERARWAGIPAEFLGARAFGDDRAAYDAALADRLDAHGVTWVALAGFLRLVGPALLERFPWRILNVHPALLPSFPGLHAQEQALAAGVRIAGATVHLVDGGCDTGPIVLQGAVPVLPEDDAPALSARILTVEHQIYPTALRWAVEGRIRVEGSLARLALPDDERPFVLGAR